MSEQKFGKVFITIKSSLEDGTELPEINWEIDPETFKLNQDRDVYTIRKVDGTISELVPGVTRFSLQGTLLDPKALRTKSIEELEQEMRDWVEGKQDWHDKVIQDYRSRLFSWYQKEISWMKDFETGLPNITPEDSAEWKTNLIKHFQQEAERLVKYSQTTPGRLGIKDGKVVDLGPEHNLDGEYLVDKWNEAVQKKAT